MIAQSILGAILTLTAFAPVARAQTAGETPVASEPQNRAAFEGISLGSAPPLAKEDFGPDPLAIKNERLGRSRYWGSRSGSSTAAAATATQTMAPAVPTPTKRKKVHVAKAVKPKSTKAAKRRALPHARKGQPHPKAIPPI